ncbi:hypothetical protein GUJ93_ZPchr0001g29294 [Zizania palustris]|uniref:GDSL esterase/lipase n=1 Tax=Zizania palustris TaxID=103762 RepID=A0A8J5RTB0_ZIZPA|nr:hypothetical protein GUJ93_ZPchr0001g29294 [Zizania palustris]
MAGPAPAPAAKSHSRPYIISFGDSLADTGNLPLWQDPVLPAAVSFMSPPYGETFFGHPTGRASDGRLVIDFVADALGLPLVSPSLAQGQDFTAGINFAVSGAPALNLTYLQGQGVTVTSPTNVSLNDQLSWFEKSKHSLCRNGYVGDSDCFGKSLFIMGEFGANDYGNILYSKMTLEEASAYVPKIIDTIANGVERLILHGARHIVVADITPLGCMASMLTLLASTNNVDYDVHGCHKGLNMLSQRHNSLLCERIAKIRSGHPYTRIIAVEHYQPIISFLQNPDYFGFNSDETLVACCGAGGRYNVDLTRLCGQLGTAACADPAAAVQWDGSHLTEAAYRRIAFGWLHGPYADPPILHVARG